MIVPTVLLRQVPDQDREQGALDNTVVKPAQQIEHHVPDQVGLRGRVSEAAESGQTRGERGPP